MSDAKLREMQERWEKRQAPATVPAGLYLAQLQHAELIGGEDTKYAVVREFTILEGEQEGQTVRDRMQLETEYGPYFIEAWLKQMGVLPPKSFSELGDVIQQVSASAPICRIRVTKSPSRDGLMEFTNIRVLSLEGTGRVQAPAPASAPVSTAGAPAAKPLSTTGLTAQQLRALCQSLGVKFTDSDSADQLISAIKKYSYLRSTLNDDEVAMLGAIGAIITSDTT